MTTSNLKQFMVKENIPHYFIWYFICDKTGTKTPIGEKNNDPIEKVISKTNINPSKPSSYFKKVDGEKIEILLTEQEKNTLQKSFTCF